MSEKVLPSTCSLEIVLDRIHIKFSGCYIVTIYAGNRKFFKGTDGASYNKAARWAWRFHEGHYRDYYRLEQEQ